MLSILVTYYNQEQYVSRSLDSIFSQKLDEPFEVLIGDDGSQDNTCKIVNEYIERYPGKIKLNIQSRDLSVKYNPVQRASKNRLDLLRMAKGDYVCFLDGDDEYCDYDWLQESVDLLKKDKTLAGIAHNYCEKYSDGKIITPAGIGQHEYITAKLYARQLYTHVGSILFRNTFTEKDYNLLISLKSFDDNDITFYFLNYGNLKCIDKVVYSYFQNEGSIWNSTSDFEKSLINAIDFEIIKKYFRKYKWQLLYKYFDSYYMVFKNKKNLLEDKYQKYLDQAVYDGRIRCLFNWKKLPIIKQFSIKIYYNLTRIWHANMKVLAKLTNFCGKKIR